jgi:hypothetical protein
VISSEFRIVMNNTVETKSDDGFAWIFGSWFAFNGTVEVGGGTTGGRQSISVNASCDRWKKRREKIY